MIRHPKYHDVELDRQRDGTWNARFKGEKQPCVTGMESQKDVEAAVEELLESTRKRILSGIEPESPQ